jgi:hypothetical protein
MAAKSFKGGMETLLGETKKKGEAAAKRGRPKTNFKEVTKTSQIGTKQNETRATFIVSEEQLEKLKAVAFLDRVTIKDVIGEAFSAYLGKRKDIDLAVKTYKGKK